MRATDAANNPQSVTTLMSFSYDSEDPTSTVTTPTNNAKVNTTPLTLTGTSTDTVGVENVRVSFFDSNVSAYWMGTALAAVAEGYPL